MHIQGTKLFGCLMTAKRNERIGDERGLRDVSDDNVDPWEASN